jgi:hypothetical protein
MAKQLHLEKYLVTSPDENTISHYFAFIWNHSWGQETSPIPEKYYPKPKICSYEVLLGAETFSIIGYQSPQASPTGSGFGYFVPSLETSKSFSAAISASRAINRHIELKALLSFASKSFTEKLDSIRLSPDSRLESINFVRSEQPRNHYITLQVIPQYLFGKKI